MKGIALIKNKLLMVFLLTITALSYAGAPVWTFTPLTATSVSVPSNGTATIQYQVTNQSAKSHSLLMTPIAGITQTTTGAGVCSSPFTLPSRGSSCTLSLTVNGSQLTHSITDGPIVCEQGSTLQCYRPSPSNVLNINVGMLEYTIGGTVSGLSGSVVLQNNGADNETVSSDGGFTFSTAITEGSPYAVTVLTQPTGQTCAVTNGSGTVGSTNVTNVGVTCVSNDTTLTASVSTLGLSVNCQPSSACTGTQNAALTGTPRLITITNTGSNSATNVTYLPSPPTLPSGTTISPASCGTIAASGTCVLTITPGDTASATAGDTSPTPITLSISGTNTNTLTPTLNIVTYGSIYQGGYIYAVDDTTPDTGSIGGTVVTQTDQAPRFPGGVVWSSNGTNSTSVSNDSIPGIAETSTTGSSVPTYAAAQTLFNSNYSNESTFPFPSSGSFSSCNGRTNGACNSTNILTLYNTYITNYGIGGSPYTLSSGPTTSSFYAAGRCTATISGYSDWYLPAICEMGPNSNDSGCSASTQNIVNQLPGLVGDPNAGIPSISCTYGANCLAGNYWSSTEDSVFPTDGAWGQNFASGGSFQFSFNKLNTLGVRCSRALTL